MLVNMSNNTSGQGGHDRLEIFCIVIDLDEEVDLTEPSVAKAKRH